MKRTLINSVESQINQEVKLNGWVERFRLMGKKMAFLSLRDRTGVLQCVLLSENFDELQWSQISSITMESVVEVYGKISMREDGKVNENNSLGQIELIATNLVIQNKSAALPIPVVGDGYDIKEEQRLAYRYLDLRRERLHTNLVKRSRFIQYIREELHKMDFVEVETPILTASTKEGARDMVVPSRINPGKFYALPQSPQQYKQLLMTSGVEKYFQIAKCFRDENLRADRGFEFTQLDLEISFTTQEEVFSVIENTLKSALSKSGAKLREGNFPIFTYDEVLEKFGGDKFDIRTEEEKSEGVLAFAFVTKYPMFKKVDLEDVAEVRDGKSGWTFTHNPFSGINPSHAQWHLNAENIEKIEAAQYDLVCNGYEIGSGSIRNHSPEMLRATYKIMGYSDEEIEESIGHMLKAFELGTPPHGGMGLGIDRLLVLLTGEKSLKEVMAFPMTYQGRTSVMDGPGKISDEQRSELGLNNLGGNAKDKMINFLHSSNINFSYISHQPSPTCEDTQNIAGLENSLALKSLILKGKKTNTSYMFVIPCTDKLDLKNIASIVNEPVEMQKKDFIETDLELTIGGVPPFGWLFDLKTFWAQSILNAKQISFSSGEPSSTINMNLEQISKIKDKFVTF